ncbi:MAG: signal peptidase I [Pirellulaceae bacterium]
MSKIASTPDIKEKDQAKDPKKDKPADGGWRETVESIAMAIILALLFRGFVAEAFVIPTGSMAPTLMGRHKDVKCPECGQWYKTGASSEWDQDSNGPSGRFVTTTTCPVCRYTQRLDLFDKPNDLSFDGDRIIVSKFAYELYEPERWDVIVFKYPGAATINYIKRLIGLPGETIKIGGGNIYAKKEADKDFQIARKPPGRLSAMLQLVDDSDHIPPRLTDVGWPHRWQQWPAAGDAANWRTENGGKSFSIDARDKEVWLRYRHLVPSHEDWKQIMEGKLTPGAETRRGSLITDFAAYNAWHWIQQGDANPDVDGTQSSASLIAGSYRPDEYDPAMPGPGEPPNGEPNGLHWADDLAVDCLAKVESGDGELALDLVQAGVHYRCRINLADGKATLSMDYQADLGQKPHTFESDDGKSAESVSAQTAVKGPGTYRLRLSNIDRQILLWVNGSAQSFDGPTTYHGPVNLGPFWSPEDPLDLAPAGVAAKGCRVEVSSLKIHRDIYYLAVDSQSREQDDYSGTLNLDEFRGGGFDNSIDQLFSAPELWEKHAAFFTTRRNVEFELQKDQFFPMGDNSPQSQDARIWPTPEHYVDRDLLIGRAMCVYWPHTWNSPVWFTPNPGEMRRIR